MGRRATNRMFRDFLCSLVIGFITGYVASQTVLIVLWRRQEASCRHPWGWGRHRAHASVSSSILDLDDRKNRLVFIGVMTTWRYLATRADAIYKTWGQNVPGKLVFFVGTGESHDTSLPVIVLSDVLDDVYPPQRKSFSMLRYMSSHLGNDYLWYMRLDDDVYVNTKRLGDFLNSVNSSNILYMGHPGTGKMEERGQLGLHGDKPYCMGGPGVVLSRTALNMVTPYLPACLNDTVTPHEDSELGRCVERVIGLSCTLAKEFDSLFSQNYKEKSGAWTSELKSEKLSAISFHPIKQHAYMYALNIMVLAKTIRSQMIKIESLQHEQNLMKRLLSLGDPEVEDCGATSCDLDTGIVWECVNAYDIYSLRSGNLKDSVLRQGRVFGLAEARRTLGQFLKQNGVRKKLRIAPVSYQRISPHGFEHVIVTKDMTKKLWMFRSLQKFDPIYFREIALTRTST